MADSEPWQTVSVDDLSQILCSGVGKCLVIDSRSFLEFNTCHITESVNVSSSKLIKRRLQQDKLSVQELLRSSCRFDVDVDWDIIVYDQCTSNPTLLTSDCFLVILITKLTEVFKNVFLLKGGFLEFQATHPGLCRSQTLCSTSAGGGYKCPPLTSMSQPCLPVSNNGPTKILPFLFLGSQQDALSPETMQQNGITYVLNVSTTSPRPAFIQEGHFLRIPVNDSYCDKLLPFFQEAFQFLDKVRESNSCALVHCLAGISRSPTLAIAYIMRHLGLTTDEAYKYVKDKRPTISPNFNFLGQLLEYEQQLREQKSCGETVSMHHMKRPPYSVDLLSPASPPVNSPSEQPVSHRSLSLNSPTTALAQLNFTQPSPVAEELSPLMSPDGNKTNLQMFEESTAFTQLPTASIDQLSFTSCFACVDSLLPVAVRGSRTAAKRLLDNDQPLSDGDRSVTLRSHGSQVKRQLVRPSSIAFTSLTPLTDRTCKSSQTAQDLLLDTGCHEVTLSEPKSRKSRSLEDILNSPDECSGRATVYESKAARLPSAADILGPSTCTDPAGQWWPIMTVSSADSQDSSVASRTAPHDSVEVIQVS